MGRNCEIMTIFAGVLWQKPAYGWRRILHQKKRTFDVKRTVPFFINKKRYEYQN